MRPETIRNSYAVRQATEEDKTTLTAIELNAVALFKTIPALADLGSDHASPEQLSAWLSNGRIYIAEDNGKPVGYVAAVTMDTTLYIAEISSIQEYQGKGVGTRLVAAVFDWARELAAAAAGSRPRVSLTTYREVVWNAPWYRKRGFKEVDAESIGPKHIKKMMDDGERNLARPGYTRCCMLWEEE